MDDTRGDDDEFMFDGMNEDVDLREEDFDFFDDGPSGECDAEETLVSDVDHPGKFTRRCCRRKITAYGGCQNREKVTNSSSCS